VTLVLSVVGVLIGIGVGMLIARSRRHGNAEVGSIVEPPISFGFGDVLEGHPSGVVIGRADGTVEYRNAAAKRLAGTHSGVLLDEAIERNLTGVRLSGTETLEFYGPPKLVFELSARAVPDERRVVFVEDVSERHRIEHVRTDFVANVSHELKTPIGALSVLAETLIDEDQPATIRRVVERMLAETDRAIRTIDDLMELSRIEAGGEPNLDPVRLGDVISGAVDRVTELAASLEIAISTLDGLDETGQRTDSAIVRGDRRQLTSAVGNLVENAVKYSEPGSSVQIRVRRNEPWIEISVSDQGVGIPQRDLDRVFERFYRVDRARSRTTGGTGLGLAIVRHVASNHDGEVVVSSTEGEGSTFVLRLPLDRLTQDPSAATDADRHNEGVA
jgi:two-component system sensor histidine kinase SenX3